MIAALYVATNGCYFGLPDVDPWDEKRDAKLYAGPHPVIAHPPCERWGRFWAGSPMMVARGIRKRKGDDGGTFAAALAAVRKWGGVLEHPAGSGAWAAFGLTAPPPAGGWVGADGFGGGWTCCVEQGNYGLKARKPTWLYAHGVRELPSLVWGRAPVTGYVSGPHRYQRKPLGSPRANPGESGSLVKSQRAATPLAFRDLLLSIAGSTSSA